MIFSWLRSRRRRAIRQRPFPPLLDETLSRVCRQAAWLDEADAQRWRQWIALFLAEKRFEGCGGQRIDDDVRLAIAGQAGLVALGFPDELFDRLKSILVYPGDWVGKKATSLEGGVHLEWRERRLGEANGTLGALERFGCPLGTVWEFQAERSVPPVGGPGLR